MGGISDDYANAFVVIQFWSDSVNAPKVAQGDVAGGAAFAETAMVACRTQVYVVEETLHIFILSGNLASSSSGGFQGQAKALPSAYFVSEINQGDSFFSFKVLSEHSRAWNSVADAVYRQEIAIFLS